MREDFKGLKLCYTCSSKNVNGFWLCIFKLQENTNIIRHLKCLPGGGGGGVKGGWCVRG
jgi:hypothetical protein